MLLMCHSPKLQVNDPLSSTLSLSSVLHVPFVFSRSKDGTGDWWCL